jgi:hypothetical protein
VLSKGIWRSRSREGDSSWGEAEEVELGMTTTGGKLGAIFTGAAAATLEEEGEDAERRKVDVESVVKCDGEEQGDNEATVNS